jgi:hypothetical protein
MRLGGSPAAANTITRKRAVFHKALGYAVELGLLPANPAGTVQWRAPKDAAAVTPQAVASHGAGPGHPGLGRPDAPGPGGVLGLPVLRGAAPPKKPSLSAKAISPSPRGRGPSLSPALARTAAWTSTGKPHELWALKHRPTGTIRIVPILPILVCLLRQHIRTFGTARMGGCSTAPAVARSANRSAAASARGPYDLQHVGLSLWLNASGAPAEVAARAGTSVRVLEGVYAHCIGGQEDIISQRIEDALTTGSGVPRQPQPVTASGSPNRRHREPETADQRRQLRAAARRRPRGGPAGQPRNHSVSRAVGSHPRAPALRTSHSRACDQPTCRGSDHPGHATVRAACEETRRAT